MKARKLRKLLEKTDDKFSIFANVEILNKCDINGIEFLNLISDFLTDEEKLKLFDYPHFEQSEIWLKAGIIGLISDEDVILKMIYNGSIMSDFENNQIVDIIKKLNDDKKQQILYNQEFIEKNKIDNYQLKDIISTLNDKAKSEILIDKKFVINTLHLTDIDITNLSKNILDEEAKIRIFNIYKSEEKFFNKYSIIKYLTSLNIKNLNEFLLKNREFFRENDIKPFEITINLNSEKQKEFVEKIENIDLSLSEKREILATLKMDVKNSIDSTNFPNEYKTAINMQVTEDNDRIILDLKKDLEDYKGLDNLISINPEKFNKEERNKFLKLCDICPNLKVTSNLYNIEIDSTVQEYKEAEEWIDSIINNLNPEYSKAQKMAIIDSEIGKKISYSPDIDTEVFNQSNCRALWKIISSGYGICNGISKVEQYILNRVGIESEIIGSCTHSFLKIKDIELPLANGEIVKGNTILDPTWNLASNRFGGMPNNFCISYDKARKNDIDENGKDHNCHQNDEKLKDATLNLDEQSLRNLFSSVGIADKNGNFPINELLKSSRLLDEIYASRPDQNISKQLLLLSKTYPNFATCQNSSMKVLAGSLLSNENFKFNRCIVNRVYNKKDKNKQPILFVYADLNEFGEKFYFADKDVEQFVELSKEDFTKQFECYEEDIKKHNGFRLWENKEQEKEGIDLSKSSGKIVAKEGEVR